MAYVADTPGREIEVDLAVERGSFRDQPIPVEMRESARTLFWKGLWDSSATLLVRHGRGSRKSGQPPVHVGLRLPVTVMAPESKWHLPRADSVGRQRILLWKSITRMGKRLRRHFAVVGFVGLGACVDSTSDWNEGEDVVIQVLLDKRTLLVLPAQVLWKRMFSKTHQYGLKFREYPAAIGFTSCEFVRD
jgi:hypothetical protein